MDFFQSKLFTRINYERQVKIGIGHFKLHNLLELLRRIGQPHLKYPVIHVAGTKGKGSTSTMIASILSASGRKTGIYTSPHLESLRQRIAIDGGWISNEDLESVLARLDPHIAEMDLLYHQYAACQAKARLAKADSIHATEILVGVPQAGVDIVEQSNLLLESVLAIDPTALDEDEESFAERTLDTPLVTKPLTFFEVITAAAMLHFADQECEAVVLEVGLGGRLDSTNVCQPEVCVITNISIDHTRQLGDTVDKIAFEKAGIIKHGIPVVSGAVDPDAATVIAEVAASNESEVLLLGRDFAVEDDELLLSEKSFSFQGLGCRIDELQLQMLGQHQRANAALAIAVAKTLNQSEPTPGPQAGEPLNNRVWRPWAIDDSMIRNGLAAAKLEGRTEITSRRPTIVLDIAHNLASIEAMVKTLTNELPGWSSFRRKTIVFGTSKDKDARGMLKLILPHFDEIVVTQYLLNPRAVDCNALGELAKELNQEGGWLGAAERPTVLSFASPEEAWHYATATLTPEDFMCVAGSAFLVAELGALARSR